MKVSSLCWGVVFVGIGIFFLAINTGYLDYYVWIKLISLWPVILIAIGIALIFSRTKLKFLALLAPLLLALTFIYVGLSEWNGDGYCSDSYRYSSRYAREVYEYTVEQDSAVERLSVELAFGLGEMWIGASPDALFDGDFEYRSRKPSTKYDVEGGEARLRIKARDLDRLNIFKRRNFKNDSRVFIADYIPIELNLDIGAAFVELDMADHNLKRLDLDTGASEIDLRLGCKSSDVRVDITSGASDIVIRVPHEMALEIDADIAISDTNFRSAGLNKSGGKYRSDNLGSAECTANINIDSGVSEINIYYY